MKKIFAILLVLTFIFTLSACGTTVIDNTASDEQNDTQSDVSSETTNTSSVPEATNPSSNTASTEEGHAHSYTTKTVPATCTHRGSTTYTCACGDTYSTEIDFAHVYSGYFCTKCQQIDRTKVLAYLKEVIETNGNSIGAGSEYILNNVTLECDYTNNIIIRKSGFEGSNQYSYQINLSKGTFIIKYGTKTQSGNFDAKKLTGTTKVCSDSELNSYFHTLLNTALQDMTNARIYLTLADLGFEAY